MQFKPVFIFLIYNQHGAYVGSAIKIISLANFKFRKLLRMRIGNKIRQSACMLELSRKLKKVI